jgi:hypothetical protein
MVSNEKKEKKEDSHACKKSAGKPKTQEEDQRGQGEDEGERVRVRVRVRGWVRG